MSKVDKYVALIPRIQSVLSGETDEIAKMSNMAALLHFEFGFWWTGFYRVVSADELVLGPFQGPVACTRIRKGRGVCGTSWREERTLVVPDVEQFPGHIACSSESRSEIVVPCRKCGQIVAVLVIDGIVSFLWLFLCVRQKSGHDSEEWQICTGIENEPDARLVREPSEECRTYAAQTEHEAEEYAGNHSYPVRHQVCCIYDNR